MFENQVVWITGASSGIGEALALQFAAAKARLVLSARRGTELDRVWHLCAGRGLALDHMLILPLDVTDFATMPGAAARVMERFGRVDMLINNAGISQRSRCVDTDLDVYRRLLEVNVLGQIALTKQVLPLMIEQHSGHIVVTASVAGKVGAPFRTGYCAAKHAVMGFFDALRAEVAKQGIRVTTITPGFIRTEISVNALRGDGSEYGELDADIAGGMDVTRCAEVIMQGFRKGTPEIAVGEGMEMKALWMKRLFPKTVFKLAARMAG
jgi:NAD(P)-dependent dehydrogenase (short-subunit alcohol dehydrogenase family)